MFNDKHLPYGRQSISEDDIAAVVEALHSDWLTTGPGVDQFEKAVSAYTGSQHAVAVSSGTAALHCAMHALGIGHGDEVIVPSMTFAATSNAVIYCGGTPIFADVSPDTLLIDPVLVAARITPKTRAVIIVDYAGLPGDYDEIRALCQLHNLALVADSCHAIGANYKGRAIGSIADLTTFSFHPVKHITTGEGGMITTGNGEFASRMRTFRNHGITTDHRQRIEKGSFSYEMVELGFNYRLTDFQSALGTSQLRRLPRWIEQRNRIASSYDSRFASIPEVQPLVRLPNRSHAYHLYVVRVKERNRIFAALREQNIGVNVHYIPVHLHPFYQRRFGYGKGLCPLAEAAYEEIISLPIFPQMEESDVERVVNALKDAVIS